MKSWDWFFDLADRCVKESEGDRDRALEMMVAECMKGIPQPVLEHECRSYIDTVLRLKGSQRG